MWTKPPSGTWVELLKGERLAEEDLTGNDGALGREGWSEERFCVNFPFRIDLGFIFLFFKQFFYKQSPKTGIPLPSPDYLVKI